MLDFVQQLVSGIALGCVYGLIALGFGFTTFAPEVAAVSGTAASGIVALIFASRLFSGVTARDTVSIWTEAKPLLAYAAPISVYQMFNAFILRLDVIMLGWFIGRAPGVTLATVGVYSAVVGLAGGLRKVNQAFNPIFAPVVAGMTATGDQQRAAATYARLAEWMLWILLPLVAVMTLAGSVILLIYGPAFMQGGAWLGIVGIACATNAFVSLGETVIMVQRPHLNLLNSSVTCAVAFGANLWLIPRFGAMPRIGSLRLHSSAIAAKARLAASSPDLAHRPHDHNSEHGGSDSDETHAVERDRELIDQHVEQLNVR